MQKLPFRCVTICLILLGTLAFAQDEPPLVANAHSLAMMEQYLKELDLLKEPEAKGAALNELLVFQLRFAEKTSAAATIKALVAFADALDKGPLRNHLLESAVLALSELDDYDGAVKTIDLIDKPLERAECQLNVAEKFLAEREKKKQTRPFDVAALLRKAVAGAVEAKDPGLEALTLAVLGNELLQSENVDEAKAVFQKSQEKARGLEELEERNILGLMIRNWVRAGRLAEAMSMIDSTNTDETKAALTGMIAVTEARKGRLDAARKAVDSIQPGNARDNALVEIGRQSAKTESAAALLELAKVMSTPERVELLQREIIGCLIDEKRFDAAEEFVRGTTKPEDLRLGLSLRRLELLIDDKKFDEAAQMVETLTDPRLKVGVVHHLASACIQAGEIDTAERLLEGSRSGEEAMALKELAAAAAKSADEKDMEIRSEMQFEILRAQLQLLDIQGVRRTLSMIAESARKLENPARRAPSLLVLAQVLSQFDKARSQTILGELFTFLAEIKDPMVLKDLVPPQKPDAPHTDPAKPVLVLDWPVDESAVKEQFFILYANIANLSVQVGDGVTAGKALGKATEMLAAESDPMVKLQKRLLLAQIYAEIRN